ncbi:MAG: fucose permease [Kurthia sp.]|uniref:fucose permease n=1 Tax=unclassified Lysinibacillus TaxID=2636778 RepID=UPI000D528820|nr:MULTISPECIES: fucose permease [unclassified Lysinibacillus]AWE06540.1 fucose permease [Lysinibacillus sp. 2017]MBQ0138582.1 fucose permease [Candidatus Kurthia equi]TGN35423.1 fucose permease [Lysinibacillus sp. S2017]
MHFTKKQVIISVGLALVIISCIIFVPAILTAKNEDKAAAELSEIYNDQFVVTKSTVGAVNDDFDITVQSEKSKIVYDFISKDRDYSGEYYAENVNAKVNELVQPIVGEETMVMSNVFQDGLQEEIALEDAKVEKAAVHLLVEQDLTEEMAQQIAHTLKAQFGEIPVAIEAYVVDEEGIFDGIKTEVRNFFQLSKIDADSFIKFKFHEQKFDL